MAASANALLAAALLIKAAHLLDPRSGHVLSPAAVLVEDGRIKEVASQLTPPAGATTIDLGGETLLPGLIDGHAHLLLDVVKPPEAERVRRYNGNFVPGLLLAVVESPNKRVLIGAQLAREDLESGFTTVRNLGHSGIDGDAALRDAINAGRITGPRLLASGRKLAEQSRHGYVQGLNPALADAILQQEFLPADGSSVVKNLFYNVDVIKVAVEDDVAPADMKAIVEAAHRQGVKVAVHAGTTGSIQTAIDAGADSIEHGNDATDEQLRTMRDRGIFLDLTLVGANPQRASAMVQRVLKSGVKFAAGSDMGWHHAGKTRGQASAMMFSALRDAGMPPLDVVRSVTTSAAEMLGWQDRIGSVEAGKYADLVAIAGDPLTDVTELERVRFVMKGGEVIRNDAGRVAGNFSYFPAAAPGPGVLLFPQSNRTRESWNEVATRLATAGIHTLTVDLHTDIEKAWQYLISQPGVQRDRIGLGGAGVAGVINSIDTARAHVADVKSLALLSGETPLPGLQFLHEASQLPELFVVSDDDEYPPIVEGMELIYITASSPERRFIHYPAPSEAPWIWYEPFDIGRVPATGSHGTDLFARHPDLPGMIVDWFVTTLIKTPGHAPADTLASAATIHELDLPGGVARVTQQLTELRRRDPAAQLFPEVTVSIQGQDQLRVDNVKAAVEIFTLNLLAYPDSADAHTNLAMALLRDGQKNLARQHAEAAIAILDAHTKPASSWSDTAPQRDEIRRAARRILDTK